MSNKNSTLKKLQNFYEKKGEIPQLSLAEN